MLFFLSASGRQYNVLSPNTFCLIPGHTNQPPQEENVKDHKGSERVNSICKAWGILGTCISKIMKTAAGECAQ